MEQERKKVARGRGCIKTTKGPWIVRRQGKGGVVESLRKPSECEREKNKQREQHRRKVANKIFAGLRQHGNYKLPKHPSQNDLLISLCKEAGYHVDQDGKLSRKNFNGESSGTAKNSEPTAFNCNNSPSKCEIRMQPETEGDELSLELTISYKYM